MVSFTLSLLQGTVGASSTRALIDEVATYTSHCLPYMLCYFVMAMLAIMPQTRAIRIALYPVIVVLALRAAVPIDVSFKITERKLHHKMATWMIFSTVRPLGWALARKPLVRQLRPVNSTPSTLMDALDLVLNLRGYGWDWAHGVHVPRETRPSNHTGFILHTIISAATRLLTHGILHTAIRSFFPPGLQTMSSGPLLNENLPFLHRAIMTCFPVRLGDIPGGSIFDESLPCYLRFLRSTIISAFAFLCVYAGLQAFYDLCTLFGVLALGQDPAQWPPPFDAPWRATSLVDFWGRRWHQFLRYILLVLGGYPLSFILGRAGIVIGGFFVSAVIHYVHLTGTNSKSEFWRVLVGFGMMAPGIIIEDVFKNITGRKVRGLFGRVWTLVWMFLWGNVIVEGFARAGIFGYQTPIDLVPPVRTSVEYLVTQFDNLLHAVSTVQVA